MHGLQAVIEKGLDSHGQSAIAQMDIKRFYDSIWMLRIHRYLVHRGFDVRLSACLLRLHVCPAVIITFARCEVAIGNRTIGVLTGTRTAGLLGRIPVEDTIQKRHHVWEQYCFKTDHHALALATYVDNLFSTGVSVVEAVAILQDCELHLQSAWGLSIGRDSKSFMAARGAPAPDPEAIAWAHSHGATFTALGHTLADNGSIKPCFSNTIGAMWRAFYGNFGKRMCNAPQQDKIKLLNRAVLPIATYRMPRWPYQRTAAQRVDRTQNKMLSIALGVKAMAHETPEGFVRRKNRIVSQAATSTGKWSAVWKSRVGKWSDHLNRAHNGNSWAAKTLHYHGKEWLQKQRIMHAVGQFGSMLAGRTCTRSIQGVIHKRWHDGVDLASS